MLGFGFTGRAGDERRADGDPRHPVPQLGQQRLDLLPRHPPPHRREDHVVDVLKRHVDVFHHAVTLGDRADHLIGEAGRIGVHEAQPVNVLQVLVQRPEQAGKARLVVDVGAVAGGVLADEVQLDRAVGGKLVGFQQDLLDRLGSHRPADRRDRAEGASLVASLGHTQISVMARRQPQPSPVILKHRQPIGLGLPT